MALEKITLPMDVPAECGDLTATLTSNPQKIIKHEKYADSIVKNILLHSRTGAFERRVVDPSATTEEALNLAYYGVLAETPSFNITMEKP